MGSFGPMSGARWMGRRQVLAGAAVIGLLAGCSPGAQVPPATVGPGGSASPTAAAATAAASAPAASASAAAEAGLTWVGSGPGFERSFIRVPLDYADPDGEQIAISIARRAATDPARRIGTLVYLPGGPGDEGVAELRNNAERYFTDAVRQRFDIVAFDARGNPRDGLEPNVRCSQDGEAPEFVGDPRTVPVTVLVEQAVAANRELVEACVAGSDGILPLIGTSAVVQDIDRIREALGEDELSFVGISYGTVTGQRYAERYPEHVRAMVLDAPVDLAADTVARTRDWATTQQRLFDAFLAACAADSTCAIHNDGRPRELFEDLVARLASAPLDGISAADLWTVLDFGLRQPDQLDEQLAAIAAGDTEATSELLEYLAEPSRGGYSLDMWCSDFDYARTEAGIADHVAALRPDAPDFAWLAAGEAACVPWPVAAPGPAAPVRAAGAPPILVVGSTDDPSTPYAWAESVAGQFESGSLLTRVGTGHGSIYVDNPCIDGAIDSYLVDLEVPASGTKCE